MNSLGISIKNLELFGNAELTSGDNYIVVNAKENCGVSTGYFKSLEDAVRIKVRGRTLDEAPLGYRLCSYDESGSETLIYQNAPKLDRDGCFDIEYTFDPINLSVYKNAVSFRFLIYSAAEKADIYINSFSVEEGNDANERAEEEKLEINNITPDGKSVYVMQKDGKKLLFRLCLKR